MKISEKTLRFLAKAISGNNKLTPYKSGPQLIEFFVNYGANDQYGPDFPSRETYTLEKLREYNESKTLKLIIEDSVDPRDFIDSEIELKDSISTLNTALKFDGFELKEFDDKFKITDSKGILIEPETVNKIDQDFIKEQLVKCNTKIEQEDYNGAITNARSLAEAVMIEIIEEYEGKEIKNDGKLDNLYKQVKKILKLSIEPKSIPGTIIQILSGLDSIVSGMAGLSNNSGDRHANKFKTSKHHARLAVNASMTLVDFLLESKQYQTENKDKSKSKKRLTAIKKSRI